MNQKIKTPNQKIDIVGGVDGARGAVYGVRDW